jgi:hypothetical protein
MQIVMQARRLRSGRSPGNRLSAIAISGSPLEMVHWTISFAFGKPLLTLRQAQGEEIKKSPHAELVEA